MTDNPTLLAIFAHPDDEAFGTGGTLTKYAQAGVDVHLVTATLGEAGKVANPAVKPDQPMSILRERELRCACDCYGLAGLHLLGYTDGQTTIAPQQEAVYRLVRLIRRLKPQVVLSFGPEGIYGHYDHLAVHRWATAAVQLAAAPERWPDAGLPHAVQKFYHRAVPVEQVAEIEKVNGSPNVDMDGVPFPFTGYPASQITTTIDVSAHWQTKIQAIRCHASQLSPDALYFQTDFNPDDHPWMWRETFILAYTAPGLEPDLPETDLFAGIS